MLMACDCMQACTFCEMRSITWQFVVVCLTCRFSVYYLRKKLIFCYLYKKYTRKKYCLETRSDVPNGEEWYIILYAKTPHSPQAYQVIWLDFCSLKWGIWLYLACLVWHLTSVSKRCSASQVKGTHHSFIQHVHCVHGSLLLYYSFLSWSIWEPLKKPVKCGLSGINKWGIWPKMRHSRSGIWLLSQNADQHHNQKDLAGGLFYHFNCQQIYWEIWPKEFAGRGERGAWAVKYWNWVVHAFLSSMASETTSRQ